ncbi:hypothetical protein FOZ61_001810 [Perkinsus olseni]|uniref:Uncharacterized protein n=1 Tax=Perkinsus olseni TaxID=32597 RepID=A0A7J6LVA6_PEROL|nr:hypothetical protein FOZ61_001810 [Perkinsus olseni]
MMGHLRSLWESPNGSADPVEECYLAAAESLDACKKEKTETERVLMELLLKAGESRDKAMNEMLQSLDTL